MVPPPLRWAEGLAVGAEELMELRGPPFDISAVHPARGRVERILDLVFDGTD
jgi:hypothetical protein